MKSIELLYRGVTVKRHIYLGLIWLLSLLLLSGNVAVAGGVDNCSASQLPLLSTLNTQTTEALPVGSAIPGSDVMTEIVISCSAAWDDNMPDCDGEPNWALSLQSRETPMGTSIPGVYTFAGMPTGIGYQFLNSSGMPVPLDSANRHDTGVAIRTGEQNVPIRFQMVKTSNDLSSGSFTIPMYLSCNRNEWANGNGDSSTLNMTVNAEVITQTCGLVNPDVQVQLPQVGSSSFRGVGSSARATGFTLDFQCDAAADARFNIADATELGNDSDALALMPGSTATGLGVRLLHQGTPVHLAPGQVFDQGGSEFPLRNQESGQVSITLPFSAEYLQTEEQVTPGTVQAQALVTIDYN